MKVEFRESFARDLRAVTDQTLRTRVKAIIENVEQAETLDQISNLKRLRGGGNYYRIRVGDYRIGLSINQSVVIFVRFLHRRDIYRRFP